MEYIVIVMFTLLFTFVVSNTLSILNYKHRFKPIPEVVQDIYNEEEYKKWHAYSMENFKFGMIVRAISFTLILILLGVKAFPAFQTIAENITQNEYLQIWIFFAVFITISFIISKILSYYDTFTIEEKYGFNKTTKKTFFMDLIKGYILRLVFMGGLVVGLFALYNNFGILFYVYGWVALVGLILIINMIYVPVLVPIFNKVTPLEDGDLKVAIEEFATSVGYQVSKISVMDASRRSSRLNAFFTGFGKFKHIVLYDTLIEKMNTEEIVAVLAHEIGHNKHKHIIFNLFTSVMQLAAYFGLLMLILSNEGFSTQFGFNGVHFGFSIIIFMEMLSAFEVFVAPALNGLSRKAEYQADRYAATKYKKEPMITALKVLTKENFSNLTPHPFFVKMRYSHPPVADRIQAIQKIK